MQIYTFNTRYGWTLSVTSRPANFTTHQQSTTFTKASPHWCYKNSLTYKLQHSPTWRTPWPRHLMLAFRTSSNATKAPHAKSTQTCTPSLNYLPPSVPSQKFSLTPDPHSTSMLRHSTKLDKKETPTTTYSHSAPTTLTGLRMCSCKSPLPPGTTLVAASALTSLTSANASHAHFNICSQPM